MSLQDTNELLCSKLFWLLYRALEYMIVEFAPPIFLISCMYTLNCKLHNIYINNYLTPSIVRRISNIHSTLPPIAMQTSLK